MQISESPLFPPEEQGIFPGTRAFWAVSVALFMAGFSTFSLLYCVQPLLPVFAQHFQVGAAQSSLVLSLTTAFLALSIFLAGALSENLGKRGLMFVSMLLAAALNIAVAYAPGWHSLLALRAAEGFVLGGVPAVAMAYLAEEIDASGLGLSMGIYVGGTAFGGMIGRVGMSFLYEQFSWQTALITIGVIDLVAALVFFLLLPPARRVLSHQKFDLHFHLRAWQQHLANKRLPWVFLIGFVAMGTFVTVYNYAGFRLMQLPYALSQTQIGLIFMAYVFGIAASSLAGGLADRFGRNRVLLCGLSVSLVGLLLTLLSPLLAIIVGIILITIGFFMTHSVASGLVGRLAAGNKGHASALYLLAYYLGSSLLGSAGGSVWQSHSWSGVVLFCLLLLAIAFFAVHTLRHQRA